MNVSVIIPAFNAEKTIQATIDSILPQLKENDELIVIDDNSNDSTGYIIRKNKQAIYLPNFKNKGVAKSIKKGFDMARNDIVAIIDSDSIPPPNWIQTIKKSHQKPNTLIACGTYNSINDPYRNAFLAFSKGYTQNKNGSGTNMTINKALAIKTGLMNDLPRFSWDKCVQERAKNTRYNTTFYDCPVNTHTPTSIKEITKQSFRYGRGRTSRHSLTLTFLIQRVITLIFMPFFNLYSIHQGKTLFIALWIEYYRTIIHTGGLMYGIFNK